jgi:hypothetical protein
MDRRWLRSFGIESDRTKLRSYQPNCTPIITRSYAGPPAFGAVLIRHSTPLAGRAEESRKGRGPPRKESVKTAVSTLSGSDSLTSRRSPAGRKRGSDMSVVVFIVLTVVIFALLGLVQKLVEGL